MVNKKIMLINGRRVEVILPKGMLACDIPNEIKTKTQIANVGIRQDQKDEIIEVMEKDRSINSFVQEAVQTKLDALRD